MKLVTGYNFVSVTGNYGKLRIIDVFGNIHSEALAKKLNSAKKSPLGDFRGQLNTEYTNVGETYSVGNIISGWLDICVCEILGVEKLKSDIYRNVKQLQKLIHRFIQLQC